MRAVAAAGLAPSQVRNLSTARAATVGEGPRLNSNEGRPFAPAALQAAIAHQGESWRAAPRLAARHAAPAAAAAPAGRLRLGSCASAFSGAALQAPATMQGLRSRRSVAVYALFEKFTERSIKSVMLAQEEARRLLSPEVRRGAGACRRRRDPSPALPGSRSPPPDAGPPQLCSCCPTGQHGAHPAGPDRRGRRQGRLPQLWRHGACSAAQLAAVFDMAGLLAAPADRVLFQMDVCLPSRWYDLLGTCLLRKQAHVRGRHTGKRVGSALHLSRATLLPAAGRHAGLSTLPRSHQAQATHSLSPSNQRCCPAPPPTLLIVCAD